MTTEVIEPQPIKTAANRGRDGKFLPGNCANPNGRPRSDLSITTWLKEIAGKKTDYILPNVPTGEKTWGELVAWAITLAAVRGDMKAASEYLDRIDGRVVEVHTLTGALALLTPELIGEAQDRLKLAQAETTKLINQYNIIDQGE